MAAGGSLTLKQKCFVEEYLIDLNATQAAVRAGYSARTASAQAARLLANVKVQTAIAEAMEARSQQTGIDAAYVLQQARKLHERCMQEIEPFTDRKGKQVHDEDGRPLYVFNANGAARALELIGKHVDVQAFKERIEVEHVDRAAELERFFTRKDGNGDTPTAH